eukprot:5665113-Lingulodinium_polyedra.AAC.1
MFLLSVGEASPRVQRLLTPAEGAALQGMRPELLPKEFSRRRIFKGLGNAMTVPVVGQALWIGLMGAQSTQSRTVGGRDVGGDARSDSDELFSGVASDSGDTATGDASREDDFSSRSSDAMSSGSSSS